MNRCVPDWNMEDESRLSRDNLPAANQKKSAGPDHELVELLWRNGHVIMHSQTHRKSPSPISEFNQCPKPESVLKCGGSFGNSSNSIQEDETTSWLQYPLDDPLEKGFCSDFFYEMPTADAIDTDKLNKDIITEERTAFTESASERTNVHFQENTMPPPKSQVIGFTSQAPSLGNGAINFSHFSRPMKANAESLNRQFGDKGSGNGIQVEVEESSSMVTLGSSICGSNQVQNLVDMSHTLRNDATGVLGKGVKGGVQMKLSNERVRTDTYEATGTSSSGGSGCSFGRTGQQSASSQSHKRKGRDAEESECHSEEAEYESVKANKPAQRSTSTRRSRAAEVHNLSERRRRDRINEKMKALQELIPHCNKSDKASMLDEAIEYLKSLQLQVQLMWMGSGMAPMMFPGVQHYMSQMGMGMGHAPMPSIPGLVQSIPSVSTANRTPMCPSPTLNPLNFPNQMQNAHLPESYARYLGFQHLPPTPQAMNLYTYGSHMVQQNQTAEQTSNSCLPTDGGVPSENIQYGKSG